MSAQSQAFGRKNGGGIKPRGVAHMVLTIPREELNRATLSGMTRNWHGDGPVGLRKLLHPVNSKYFFRVSRHFKEAKVNFAASFKDLIVLEGFRGNAFVNTGLQKILDSSYGDLTPDTITHIGLSADDQAVSASTVSLDPAGGAAGTSIKTTANTSRTNQIVSADQTWTQADVTWAIRKIGLLTGSAATDVSNIIGGTGGSSPYDEPFNIDLTNIATWTLTMGIDVTATAS